MELLKEKEICEGSGGEFLKEIPVKKYPDDYYQYKLRGIVIHFGTAESGHYYSFIRDNEMWLEFNDTIVRPLDPNEIANEAFGGEEKFIYKTQTGANSSVLKSKYRNAYILLYERSSLYVYKKEEETLKQLNFNYDIPSIEFDQVKEENERYWRCKSSFSPEYFDFVLQLLAEKNNEICKFGICFFLTIMIRSRDYSRIAACAYSLKDLLKNNKDISDWLLEVISFKYVLKELLMDCPVTEKRRVIVGVVHSALRQVSPDSQDLFFKRLISYLDTARPPFSHNFAQYFELVFRSLKLRPDLTKTYSVYHRLLNYLKKTPQEPLADLETYKHDDIFLGYNNYTPEDKADLSKSENGGSLVFLINSLQLCICELNDENYDVLFEENILDLLVNEASSRYGGKSLGQFYAMLCTNNKVLTQKYARYLVKYIDKVNAEKHKPYMRLLFWLLVNQDSIISEKTDFILPIYMKQIQDNKKYPVATDSSLKFLIKIVAKIPAVKDWVNKRAKELRWLENIVFEPNGQQGKTKDLSVKASNSRAEIIRRIIRGSFNEKDWEDSDNDLIEENLPVSSEVLYLDYQTNRWVKCLVTVNIGELLCIKNERVLGC